MNINANKQVSLNTREKKPTKSLKPGLKQTLFDQFSPELKKLKHILVGISNKSRQNSNATFKDLHPLLCKPIFLIQALGNIRPNAGSSTPGINDETLNKMSLKKINSIAEKIKDQTFSFSPVKRVYVPKPGKTTLRPLGIPTYTDRIVQSGIRIILEAIYEPEFDKLQYPNFGFRQKKSPHNCIKTLRNYGTACNYAIEGDISGAYDNVDITILLSLLRKKIHDEKFILLIKQGCYSGLLDFGEYKDTLLGVPQGGIASPILFNIYMHEFDLFINYKLNAHINKYNLFMNRISSPTKHSKLYNSSEYKKLNYYLSKKIKEIKTIKNNKPFKTLTPFQQKLLKSTIHEKRKLEIIRTKTNSIIIDYGILQHFYEHELNTLHHKPYVFHLAGQFYDIRYNVSKQYFFKNYGLYKFMENKKYSWENHYIIFLENCEMDAFGKGTYTQEDTYKFQANFGCQTHSLEFNNDYTTFTAIRHSDGCILNGFLL